MNRRFRFRRVSGLPLLTNIPKQVVAGPALWLRADIGTTPATGISPWADQSQNGKLYSQGTGSAQPTLNARDAAYNNQPTLSFASANSQTLSNAGPVPVTNPFTILVVGESTSGATQQELIADTNNNCTIFWTGTVWSAFAGATLTSVNSTRTKQAFAFVANGASSALYINTTAAAAASGNGGASSPSGPEFIGSNSANFLNGKVAEVLVYQGALTTAQISGLFQYFAARYSPGAWS